MTTGNVPVNPAVSPTQYVATYTFAGEDAMTKNLERVALNESDGSDTGLAAKLGALTETAPATDTASSGINGRLQRLAQRLTTLISDIGSFVFGAGTAAAAQRVTLASDDPAVSNIGPTNETAPASDTAASGLNGRLQRIAQRLTTLITNLAFVFGAGTAAAAQRVTLASDDPAVTNIGPTNETAPASDTAASGLNGRLQRVAQRLTTLITAVGTQVFGSGTAAGAQRMTLASDDPAVATLGAKTDAKSVSTDGTSVSAMSVWKQISASVQALVTAAAFVFGAGTAAAAQRTTLASDDPAVATLGATSGAAVITDVAGTIQQYLRGLVKLIAAGLSLGASSNVIGHVIVDSGGGGNPSYTSTLSFTCGTVAYAAQDAVGVGGGSAALDLGVLGASAGVSEIVSASLEIDTAAIISGETSYRLYLYNVTPPSALADSAAWDLPSGDRASFLGYIDIGTPVKLGSTLYVRGDNIGTRIKLSGTHLFGYLVSNGAYTPTARLFLLTLHAQGC